MTENKQSAQSRASVTFGAYYIGILFWVNYYLPTQSVSCSGLLFDLLPHHPRKVDFWRQDPQ